MSNLSNYSTEDLKAALSAMKSDSGDELEGRVASVTKKSKPHFMDTPQAVLSGLTQGATLGWKPKAMAKLKALNGEENEADILSTLRKREEDIKKKSPTAYSTAELAGNLANPLWLRGKFGALASGAGHAISAKLAASDEEVPRHELVESGLAGAATGLGGHLVMPKIAAGLNWAGKKIPGYDILRKKLGITETIANPKHSKEILKNVDLAKKYGPLTKGQVTEDINELYREQLAKEGVEGFFAKKNLENLAGVGKEKFTSSARKLLDKLSNSKNREKGEGVRELLERLKEGKAQSRAVVGSTYRYAGKLAKGIRVDPNEIAPLLNKMKDNFEESYSATLAPLAAKQIEKLSNLVEKGAEKGIPASRIYIWDKELNQSIRKANNAVESAALTQIKNQSEKYLSKDKPYRAAKDLAKEHAQKFSPAKSENVAQNTVAKLLKNAQSDSPFTDLQLIKETLGPTSQGFSQQAVHNLNKLEGVLGEKGKTLVKQEVLQEIMGPLFQKDTKPAAYFNFLESALKNNKDLFNKVLSKEEVKELYEIGKMQKLMNPRKIQASETTRAWYQLLKDKVLKVPYLGETLKTFGIGSDYLGDALTLGKKYGPANLEEVASEYGKNITRTKPRIEQAIKRIPSAYSNISELAENEEPENSLSAYSSEDLLAAYNKLKENK